MKTDEMVWYCAKEDKIIVNPYIDMGFYSLIKSSIWKTLVYMGKL